MDDDIRAELIAEIQSFRAELRLRAEAHARRLSAEAREPSLLDPLRMDLSEAKALIAGRYADARYENRLRDVERRLAELESRNG